MFEAYEQAAKALDRLVMGLTARALLADAVADKLDQQFHGEPPDEAAEMIAAKIEEADKARQIIRKLQPAIEAIREAQREE